MSDPHVLQNAYIFRSWLQTADAAHALQQSQLKIIAQSVNQSVATGPNLYTSVKNAWCKAMVTLDKLIQGIPYDIQDPEVILGLLAWHIYPDMNVVTGVTKYVKQKDPLIQAGGIITIGLQGTPLLGSQGLSWSLPLSHLRYYGQAVISTGSVEEANSRISFQQLQFVTLGTLTRAWFRKDEDMEKLSEFFIELQKFFSRDEPSGGPPGWMMLISYAAKSYILTAGREREDANRLIAWGRRRATCFLSESTAEIPRVFNLSDRRVFSKALKVFRASSEIEPKLAWLRKHLASDAASNPSLDNALIRYPGRLLNTPDLSPEEEDEQRRHNHRDHPDHKSTDLTDRSDCEFASLLPRVVHPGLEDLKAHRRWICAFDTAGSHINYDSWTVPHKSSVLSRAALRVIKNSSSSEIYGLYRTDSVSVSQYATDDGITLDISAFEDPILVPEKVPISAEISPCEGLYEGSDRPRGCPQKWYVDTSYKVKRDEWFCWFGSPENVAVYSPVDKRSIPSSTNVSASKDLRSHFGESSLPVDAAMPLPILREITIDEIIQALKSDEFDPEALAAYLFRGPKSFWQTSYKQQMVSLEALHNASRLYQGLPGALVDLSIASKPLHKAKWVYVPPHESVTLPASQARSFACIAMFELGTVDVDPLDLLGVTALSSGNSLYIAEYLLRDPYEEPKEGVITRTVGNIGRPGLAFLVSPRNLEVKKPDYSTWKEINHADFDGKIESNFQETSLHLRFTGYESALNVRDHGLYDKEVFVLQAVIQAFNRGTWVADLDLVTLVTGPTEKQLWHRLEVCDHPRTDDNLEDFEPITSVDNWHELLDPPPNAFVVRAGGHWMARLAIAAVSAQRMKPFVLASEKICWECIRQKGVLDKKSCVVIC